MSFFDLLLNPVVLISVSVFGIGLVFILLFPKTSRKERVWLATRVKPDEWSYDFKASMRQPKNSSESIIRASDKTEYIVPNEKKGDYQRVYNKNKRKWGKMFPIENGQIIKWSEDLSQSSNALLDNATVSAVQNRASARRLAALAGAVGDKWTFIILAVGCGVAVGYIMYGLVNHPVPTYAYYCQLANRTVIPGVCP